jgi:hypothetical protein
LLEYALFDAIRAGFDRAVFIIRDENSNRIFGSSSRAGSRLKADLISQRLTDLPSGFSPGNRDKPWGRARPVLTVRDLVKAFRHRECRRLRPGAYEGCRACETAGIGRGDSRRYADRTLSPHGPVKRLVPGRDSKVRLESQASSGG